jgi:Dyp-type peroxidase family
VAEIEAQVQEILERDDIQGLVMRAYRMPWAEYLFYRFTGAATARSWLEVTADPLTTAAEWDEKPAWCANLGLTYPGVAALGLPAPFLASFPDDFREGMAARAAARLGDSGVDLPAHWEASPPFADRGVHAVLLVTTHSQDELATRVAAFAAVAAAHGLEPAGRQRAAALGKEHPNDREHFGFRDGISQPTLRGSGLEESRHADRQAVAPGEFVLGYVDESGARPTLTPEVLGRNGTFAVYRKLRQHVAVFRDWMRDRDGGDLLAAKLMGRWPGGTPVALAPDADDPVLAADPLRVNRFDYTGDPLGVACPRGAHVRRARPRDGNPANRRRLLLRRGLPYGEELPADAPDDGNRGLVGFFLNASIERQFEFVQRKWLNWRQFDGLEDESDPMTGSEGRDFTWQRNTGPLRFADLPRFATVCGGEYFFLPGIAAVRYLATTSDF